MTMQITTDDNKGIYVKFCKNGDNYSIDFYDAKTNECTHKEEFSEFKKAVEYHKRFVGRVCDNCYVYANNNSFFV